MRDMIDLSEAIKSEINALRKYANRNVVNIKVVEEMVKGIMQLVEGNKPIVDCGSEETRTNRRKE